MLLISFGASALNFEYEYEGQTLTYTVIDETSRTCMIKDGPRGYSSNENQVSGVLVIPPYAWFNNVQYSVVAIGKQSFEATGIVQVTIPESVTSIGNRAFAGSHQLKTITIPAGVTSMGQQVFADCLGLAEIKVESGNKNYTSLDGVLCNYEKTEIIKCPPAKTGSFHIPESATTVDENAFQGCTGLTDVTIPESVTSIGKRAFERCYGLQDVTLNNSITSLGEFAFSGSSIGTVTLPESLKTISKGMFDSCSSLEAVKIPDSVTEIGSRAFIFCSALTDVQLPESLESIGSEAFIRSGITSIKIPDNIRYIEGNTFEECTSLQTLTIGNSVNRIGNGAFRSCKSLSSLSIGNSVMIIGKDVFQGCESLTSVTFPTSVQYIYDHAFSNCKGLTELAIPASVTIIGDGAFGFCENLTAINVDPANRYYASIDGVLFDKEMTKLIQYPISKAGSCVIPGTVTTICDFAFYTCKSLTSVTIPKSVTSIGYVALSGCDSMKAIYVDSGNSKFASADGVLFNKDMTVLLQYPGGKTAAYKIPGTTKYVGELAFASSVGLTEITIPQSITYIGYGAFIECKNLMEINYPANEPVNMWEGGGFDQHTCDNAILYVRKEALDKIIETRPWKYFKNIKTKEFDVEVEEVAADADSSQPVSVYTLNGTYVGASTADLAPGIYIVRTGARATKVVVR